MKAFHGDTSIKTRLIHRVTGSYSNWKPSLSQGTEQYIRRQYEALEHETGIPAELFRLGDGVLPKLPRPGSSAQRFRFVCAIPVGADLSDVVRQFLLWLVRDAGVPGMSDPLVDPVAAKVADLLERGERLASEHPLIAEARKAVSRAETLAKPSPTYEAALTLANVVDFRASVPVIKSASRMTKHAVYAGLSYDRMVDKLIDLLAAPVDVQQQAAFEATLLAERKDKRMDWKIGDRVTVKIAFKSTDGAGKTRYFAENKNGDRYLLPDSGLLALPDRTPSEAKAVIDAAELCSRGVFPLSEYSSGWLAMRSALDAYRAVMQSDPVGDLIRMALDPRAVRSDIRKTAELAEAARNRKG